MVLAALVCGARVDPMEVRGSDRVNHVGMDDGSTGETAVGEGAEAVAGPDSVIHEGIGGSSITEVFGGRVSTEEMRMELKVECKDASVEIVLQPGQKSGLLWD